ncbi:hypothetical protein A8B98_14790 [Hymenobacter sp. UV11]|nr:hypothetical protein A8B98_14790 [Hymenobacter sp. UV11]
MPEYTERCTSSAPVLILWDNLALGGTWSSTGSSLVQNADDIVVPTAKTYTIVLTPSTLDTNTKKITGASFTVK